MKHSRFLLGFAVAVAAAALLSSSQNSSAFGIVFLETGEHTQECPAGESVSYEWFVYNGFETSYLVEARVNVSSGTGWSSYLNQLVCVLDPGESTNFVLTLDAGNDVTSRPVNQTVYFIFTDLNNTAFNFMKTGTANTKMIPVWGIIAPGKNKLLGRFDNPLPEPFDDNISTFVLNIGIWALIAIAFMYLVNPAVRLVTRKTKTDIDDRILKILHKPIFALVIVYGLVSSFSILRLTDREVGMIFKVYGIVLIAIVTFVVYKIFKQVLIRLGKKYARRTESEIDVVLIPVIDKIGGIIILVFGAIGIVDYLGYDITFILAGVGVAGLVIAFAAQDALSNFFSGIALLLDRPFGEGDHISLTSGELCRVEKIGIRSTRLYDVLANTLIVLPNNKLVNDKVVNLSKPNKQAVNDVAVNVSYGSDIGKIESVLLDIAAKNTDVMKDIGREPVVRIVSFGESAIEFKLFFWVDDFMKKWRVAHEIRKDINRRFAEEGIEIPYPQRTVHIREATKRT